MVSSRSVLGHPECPEIVDEKVDEDPSPYPHEVGQVGVEAQRDGHEVLDADLYEARDTGHEIVPAHSM